MKKTALTLVFSLLLLFTTFASSLTFQPNIGYGYIAGKRYTTYDNGSEDLKRVSLKATGVEAGFLIGYEWEQNLGIEAYFDYLFATAGSFDPDKAPAPTAIPEHVKYTDYKAGLGVRYMMEMGSNKVRLAAGLNFAGVSNHYFYEPECKTQYEGNKVTSFGVYLAASAIHPLNDRIALSANLHNCLNFTGFARNFNPGTRKWDNYFPSDGKTTVMLFATFAQMGVVVNL